MHYYYRPASITTDDSGTTWIGTNAPDALLYACLVEAYTFMKGEADLIQNYNQRFAEAINGLKLLGEAEETTQEYRVGRVLRPKQ